ncbi:MAG: SRPBCC domain-containing protein [Chitinophagaceae bacterium]
MNQEPFVIERTYNAPAERVWKAITDRNQMKEWYFDIAAFEPVVGFEFQFNGTNEGKTFVHLCKVLEVIPNKKLRYSWRYEGYEGNSFVTFELFAEGSGTRLKLTHEGLETFPPVADFAKSNFQMGWTELIGNRLKAFTEKQ